MASSWRQTARVWLRSALILGAVTAPLILMTGPAQAALSSGNWTAAAIPAGFNLVNAAPLSPVSCVHGTKFCVVVAGDNDVQGVNEYIGQGDLVTTNGGASWTGYTDLPSSSMIVTSVSCPSTKVCWAAGDGTSIQPALAKSTDGGQTWTLEPLPASWTDAPYTWVPNAIDCVSVSTCWLAGTDGEPTLPVVAETTDGGTTWTTFSNLPPGTSDQYGDTYGLNGISCISTRICVSVGGINGGTKPAAVISTTNGGASWSMSTDPELASVEDLYSVSCLPGPSTVTPVICHAAGVAAQAAGAVQLTSRNGGTSWSGLQMFDTTGWLNSISCADVAHCWAAGSGTAAAALVGTSNGGATWSSVTSDTTNEDGSVSCATADFCVATTDDALWVTSNDGGL